MKKRIQMTARLPEFVCGPVTGPLQTLRDLYNLHSEIQEEKRRETLMEHKGKYRRAGRFIQDIPSCIPGDSGTSAPSLLENSTWAQTCLLTQCTATTSTVSSQSVDSGHKKWGVLSPQASAINNLNRVDKWARIKNGTAQSLFFYILTLQAESKIRHLLCSNNVKHLQDWRINLFFCRNLPDSSTSYLVPSAEP